MFQDPGAGANIYAEFQARLLASTAAADDPRPPDPVETRTERFTSLVWTIVGLALAAGLVWVAVGEIEGMIAAAVAVAVLAGMLVRRHRLDVEDAHSEA